MKAMICCPVIRNILLITFLPYLFVNQAALASSPLVPSKVGCAQIFSDSVNIAKRAVREVTNLTIGRLLPKDKIPASQYDDLRQRRIDDYFPGGELTEERLKAFYNDFGLVAANFPRMQLGQNSNERIAWTRSDWESVRSDLMRNGFASANSNMTLEQLLIERNWHLTRPPEDVRFRDRVLNGVHAAMNPKNIILFPFKGAWWGIKGAVRQSKLIFLLVVVAPLLSTPLNIALVPIQQNIQKQIQKNFGWVAVEEQMALARIEKFFEQREQMLIAEDSMKEVTRKYQMKQIDREEAVELWTKFENVWLEHAYAIQAMVPDNLKGGRGVYVNAHMSYTVMFATLFSTANNEVLEYRAGIRDIEAQLARADLDQIERDNLEAELLEYQEGLEASRNRVGTALAMMKVYELMHPEFNRAEFMDQNPEVASLMRSYDVFMDGFALEQYQQQYFAEMDRILKGIGIELIPEKNPENRASFKDQPDKSL